ncbi:LPXTG cell wall anchor domain-containing protein [Enterococcus sp. DIV0806c]|uniref:LPXTG cell wall anchor domain-containing protein n=1 Tax=unclassified Enterococcus TaxID=2608891 RepID=UPI003F252DE7
MKNRKKIFLLVTVLLALTAWDLSETIVVEATTGQITVIGQIGETESTEKEDDDKKQTIVADVSTIEQGKLPQTGSSNTKSLIILGYVLIVLFIILVVRQKKHNKRVA